MREASTDTLGGVGDQRRDEATSGDYDVLQLEEARQREVIFRIKRYGIIVFAVFFVVFNAYYWLHLLRSQLFA